MTINADLFTPSVPTEAGEEHAVFFTKGGVEHRILLVGPSVWVIHRSHAPREQFEIVLENPDRDRKIFDASIRRENLLASALGETLGFVIAQFC